VHISKTSTFAALHIAKGAFLFTKTRRQKKNN